MSFFKKEIFSKFSKYILVTLFYWLVYLFINYRIRVDNNVGFSGFPFPPSFNAIGANDYFYFYLVSFSLIFSIIITSFSGKKIFRFALFVPAVVVFLACIFIFAQFPKAEELGGLALAFFLILAISLFFLIYFSLLLNFIFLKLTGKFPIANFILLLLFGLSLVCPFFYPFLIGGNFEDRVRDRGNIEVVKTTFKKEEISEVVFNEFYNTSNNCCSVVEREKNGEIILKNLSNNRVLIGGPVQKVSSSSTISDRTDLYVKNNNEILNITKGIDFMALYSSIDREGYGTRPMILSPNKEKIGFYKNYISDPTLYIVNLDGSKIFADENFCPQTASTCSKIAWGSDGNIYVDIEIWTGPRSYNRPSYWRVMPPE